LFSSEPLQQPLFKLHLAADCTKAVYGRDVRQQQQQQSAARQQSHQVFVETDFTPSVFAAPLQVQRKSRPGEAMGFEPGSISKETAEMRADLGKQANFWDMQVGAGAQLAADSANTALPHNLCASVPFGNAWHTGQGLPPSQSLYSPCHWTEHNHYVSRCC
jgi:hypothetical protein